METFYVIVLVVAVIMLVIVLAIFGVMMQHQNNQTVYPPTSNRCPDFWTYDNGVCSKPSSSINLGIYSDSAKTLNADPKLPPYTSTIATFDPSNNQWSLSGKSVVCAQRDWATQSGIVWDGVSNYNNC